MAVSVVRDAARGMADSFVLVTGDSDQVETVLAARKDFNKQVLVFDPHDRICDDLKMSATFYKLVPRNLASNYHLPLEVRIDGRIISYPDAWR